MNKLENASNNLKEILCAIADGKAVQVKLRGAWSDYVCDWHVSPYSTEGLLYGWRIKPDAFEEAWEHEKKKPKNFYKDFNQESLHSACIIFKAGWDARGEHKYNE